MQPYVLVERRSPELTKFPQIIMLMHERVQHKVQAHQAHTNPGIELHLILEGSYHFDVEGKRCDLQPGDALVTCPWQVHHGSDNHLDIGAFLVLLIKPEQFTQAEPLQLGAWSSLPHELQKECGVQLAAAPRPIIRNARRIQQNLHALHQDLCHPELGQEHRVHQLLDEIILMAARGVGRQHEQTKNPIINTITERIENNLTHNWGVAELAHMADISQSSLTRLMKKQLGCTPVQLIMQLRIKHSKTLLESTNNSIVQIAQQCGFSSAQHYANAFKKLTGITAKQWRQGEWDLLRSNNVG